MARTSGPLDETITAGDPKGDRLVVAVGDKVGRYELRSRAGAGAMGEVFVAWDPTLEREVALKVLHARSRKSTAEGQRRLLREAQALARLADPNVVSVHHVGTHAGRVFIVMELVVGTTLRAWLAQSPRSPREIVDAFIAAGRGLAAAHEVGLVHRDFKPDNVMMAEDPRGARVGPRVRVMDFGLALAATGGASERPDLHAPPSVDAFSQDLTRSGRLVGTPAYMAPEQFEGEAVGPAADQFAFCVALWEALYGARPFHGENLAALAFNVTHGVIATSPAGVAVPRWLRRLIVRGLARDPADRWPSMRALVDALGRDRRRRRHAWAASIIVAGAIGATWWGVTRNPEARGFACARAGEQLVGIWDDARREQLAAAFSRDERAFAADSLARVSARLDAYANSWVEMHEESCRATHERGEQSTDVLDMRTRCLRERLDELRAVTDVLVAANATVVENANRSVARLPDLEACSDIEGLARRDATVHDPEILARIEQARELNRKSIALREAGEYPIALVLQSGAHVMAEASGSTTVIAETRLAYSDVLSKVGDGADAERMALLAAYAFETIGLDESVADCYIDLMYIIGYQRGRSRDAEHWSRMAETAVARLGNPPAYLVRLFVTQGMVAIASGDADRTIELYERALAAHEATGRGRTGALAQIHTGIGTAHYLQGRYEQALPYYESSLRIYEEIDGPDHPDTATACENLGTLNFALDRPEEAYRLLMRAKAVWAGSNVSAEQLGTLHNSIGAALEAQGRYADAERWFADAIAILDAQGIVNPALGTALGNQAGALVILGRPREALPLFARAVEVLEDIMPDAVIVPIMHCQKAVAHLELGELEVALEILPGAIDRFAEDDPNVDALYRGECRLAFAQALADAAERSVRLPDAVHEAARGRSAVAWADLAEVDLRSAGARGREGMRRLERFRERSR